MDRRVGKIFNETIEETGFMFKLPKKAQSGSVERNLKSLPEIINKEMNVKLRLDAFCSFPLRWQHIRR